MKTRWPQFLKPTRLSDGRAWTAVFDSFDQRNDDVYYYVTVVEEGRDPSGFFVQVSVPPEGEGSAGPALRSFLRAEINRLADDGCPNTDYNGSLVGGQAREWLKVRRKQTRNPEPPAAGTAAPSPARGRFFTSANGRLSFEMEGEPSEAVFPLLSFLEQRFGLDSGFPVFGLDGVYSEGTADGVKLVVGWDNWSGCFIQAFDEAGDRLVRDIGSALDARADLELQGASPVAPGSASAAERPAPAGAALPPRSAEPERPRRRMAAPNGEDELDRIVADLRSATRRLDSSTCCRLRSEEAGFEETPLEQEVRETLVQGVLPALAGHPEWLGPNRLVSLLELAAELRFAVRAYRARLLSEMGEYGNAFSPLAGPAFGLMRGLAEALAKTAGGPAMLAAVPDSVLDAELALFRESDDGRLESNVRTLRGHLASFKP